MPGADPELLALLATEWFKAARRAIRIAIESAPNRFERERAQLAYSERRISTALAVEGVHMRDFDGEPYSPSLPAEPINPEDFSSEEGLIVRDTIEPTILHNGRIVMRGKVLLAKGE